MSDRFNAEEVLEIATQIERNGAKFYRDAAELVVLKESRDLLLLLAKMEDGHEALFESMKAEIDDLEAAWGDPDGVQATYLRAIAANHVFVANKTAEAVFPPDVTAKQVLKAALDAEFATIAYFQAVADSMPPAFGRDKLQAVIAEEQEHVVMINKKIIALASSKE